MGICFPSGEGVAMADYYKLPDGRIVPASDVRQDEMGRWMLAGDGGWLPVIGSDGNWGSPVASGAPGESALWQQLGLNSVQRDRLAGLGLSDADIGSRLQAYMQSTGATQADPMNWGDQAVNRAVGLPSDPYLERQQQNQIAATQQKNQALNGATDYGFLPLAVSIALGGTVGPWLSSSIGGGLTGSIASKAILGGANSALFGGDPVAGALNAGVSGLGNNVFSGIWDKAKGVLGEGFNSGVKTALSGGTKVAQNGGGMGFFSDILDGFDPGDAFGGPGASNYVPGVGYLTEGDFPLPSTTAQDILGDGANTIYGPGGFTGAVYSPSNGWNGSDASAILKGILSGSSGLGSGIPGMGGTSTGSGGFRIPGTSGNGSIDWAGKLLGAAPIIGALGYASGQGDFDTSRLEDIYGKYSPNAAATAYDLNTGIGRQALNDSLTRRGVAGSSFGNFDLGNYDTTRELGRNQLISQAAGAQAGIAGTILDAQVKARQQKNQLYGSALNALGNVFRG